MSGWIEFTGEYVKRFYDVKLNDGRIVRHCWPNDGMFHANSEIVYGKHVAEFKECPA